MRRPHSPENTPMPTMSDALLTSQTASGERTVISFDVFDRCPGWQMAPHWVLDMVDRYQCQNILEIGSGANPALSPDVISNRRLHYVANDVEPEELSKADPVFDQWVGDISRGAPAH